MLMYVVFRIIAAFTFAFSSHQNTGNDVCIGEIVGYTLL